MTDYRYYRCGGLLIASELTLDDLAAAAEPGRADVTIERAVAGDVEGFAEASDHVLSVGGDDDPWLIIYRSEGTHLARWPGQMDVLVPSGGGRLLVHQTGDVPDSIPRLLLCHALSFVLPAHGREGLHASAVEIGGRAVVITGDAGRGKSTLATQLCQQGGRLLSDDLAIVRLEDGVPVLESSSTKTWLLHDVAREMFGPDGGERGGRIHKLAVAGGIASASGAVPVAAIYVLTFGDEQPDVSVPLNGKDALVTVLSMLFNFAVDSPERLAVQFHVATELAARAPVRVVRWHPSPTASTIVATRIISQLASTNDGGNLMDQKLPVNGLAKPAARSDRAGARREVLAMLREAGIDDPFQDGFDEPLLRTSQVATLLRSSDRTVRSWADAGKLRYIKTLGGRRLFPASAVLSALRAMSPEAAEEDIQR